ncbi:tetratricopeptide repeat protein [Flavobacterium gelidilacus]|jgi:tetratricopeptide (TPR) repeat protein|uniref:tetratricopeptide repeat protein n=1 Tax=Flavobacterium gelidilacus TaxID=206041 RepID=UPI0003FF1AD0|nr:tetratricopeptide repeat protein [Flavobacterium gelidilacus]
MNRVIVYIVLLVSSFIFAQEDHKDLYKGNESFKGKKYIASEADYRVSASSDKKVKAASYYNMGNSIYRLNQPGEAKFKFFEATTSAKTKDEKHKAFHNLGNTLMLEKNYQGAVESYKNALRNNPYDEQTRYNYALAKKFLKENPPKSGGGGNDKDKNKDKDQDKNKDQDQQDKKDKKDQNKEGDKEDKGNPKPQGADKQKIENILEAVNNAEKKIQEKVNSRKEKGVRVQTDKDW